MLTIYVKYIAKEGCREKFLREIVEQGILTAIRNEDGCIMYDYYLSAQDENVVLLLEQIRTARSPRSVSRYRRGRYPRSVRQRWRSRCR